MDFGSLRTTVLDNAVRAYPDAKVELIRPGFVKIPGLSRLSAVVTHYRVIKHTIRDKKIDSVVLYSVPTNGIQAVRAAKKLGVPVIFRSIDILNELTPSPVLAPITHLLEKKVYSSADLILTISPKLTDYVMKMGARKENIRLLPLGVDTESFRTGLDTSEVRRRWGIESDTPVIVFIGTLFDFSGLDIFIPLFREVLESFPNARLLIVGDGPQRGGMCQLGWWSAGGSRLSGDDRQHRHTRWNRPEPVIGSGEQTKSGDGSWSDCWMRFHFLRLLSSRVWSSPRCTVTWACT